MMARKNCVYNLIIGTVSDHGEEEQEAEGEQSEGTSFGSLLSLQNIHSIFMLEASFEHPSLVAQIYWQDDGMVGQMNIGSWRYHLL
jgi:hypothetical protein